MRKYSLVQSAVGYLQSTNIFHIILLNSITLKTRKIQEIINSHVGIRTFDV